MCRDNRCTYLPTEIVLLVAQFLWLWDTEGVSDGWVYRRQRAFYSFCLVSRQWYSVGIGFLYQYPFFHAGNSFANFAHTLCPPGSARKTKVDLGSLVKTLNMGGLVHHSTNSLTARLLGQTKKNLKKFVGPRVSFAVNCLPSLSKCQNLQVLDLSLVSDTSIPFQRLKKAICKLPKLKSLRLPLSIPITHTDNVDQWPLPLESMTIGGRLDEAVMRAFEWPPSITRLTIRKCPNLTSDVLESILQNEQLRVAVRYLNIDNSNEEMCVDGASMVLYALPNLFHLSIPGDLTLELLLLPTPGETSRLPIRELNLLDPCYDDMSIDLADEMLRALSRNLSNVWAIGLCEKYFRMVEEKENLIDNALLETIEKCSDEDLVYLDDWGLCPLGSWA